LICQNKYHLHSNSLHLYQLLKPAVFNLWIAKHHWVVSMSCKDKNSEVNNCRVQSFVEWSVWKTAYVYSKNIFPISATFFSHILQANTISKRACSSTHLSQIQFLSVYHLLLSFGKTGFQSNRMKSPGLHKCNHTQISYSKYFICEI